MPRFSGRQDVYREIAKKYIGYIESGVYRNGDRLPSVRTAATALSVNPNTVARAYACLEERGYIRTLPKKGVYVCFGDSPDAERTEEYRRVLCAWKDGGACREELLTLIQEVFDDHD